MERYINAMEIKNELSLILAKEKKELESGKTQLVRMAELSTDRRFHSLTQEQVETLDQVLTEVIPIHGRGNFPTLEVKPKDIIHMVKDKLMEKEIKVRDVRLNGSTASHVLVKENGTSYKDLDIIFGVELPKQEDFQIIKEVVLRCLLDFLPSGVNKDKITALTMKEAYVQKMVKVFTEHDRWSLISLSNNSGKNVELKFVNSLRRQFEFSVDSFQIILDRMLESYLEAERKQGTFIKKTEEKASVGQNSQLLEAPGEQSSTSSGLIKTPNEDVLSSEADEMSHSDDSLCHEEVQMQGKESPHIMEESAVAMVDMEEVMEVNSSVPDLEIVSQEQTELLVKKEAEGKGVSVLEKETSGLKTISQDEAYLGVTNLLKTETQVHVENCDNVASTAITVDSVPLIEKTSTEGPVTLKVPCVSPKQSCGCLSQETQDSYIEYPLPPPAKKTYKKSQMVVLKHSSPKPPRKMSKKVTNPAQIQSLEKTNSPEEHPVFSGQLLDPAKTTSEESVPMLFEVAVPVPNDSQFPADTPKHENYQSKIFNVSATTDNDTSLENSREPQADVTHLQSQSDESLTTSLEVPAQSVEPEDTKHGDDNMYSHTSLLEVPPQSPQIPEDTLQVLEPAVHSPDLVAQVPESAAQIPVTADKESEPTTQVPATSSQGAQPSPEVPESIAQPVTGTEIDTQVSEPNAQILEPDVQIPQPGAQPEPSQMEVTSGNEQTEVKKPSRELPAITVVAESMYGDFEQAMDHLRYRLIATRNPEEIRGGGLLKYSNLLVREFKPASETEIKTLERYMCSRFFIDFPDVNEQQRKIESYLRNHFIGEEKSKYDYLMTLRRVVNESTVCLMGHERRQTLNMITVLALKVLGEQNIIPNTTNVTCYYQPAPYMADHSFNNYYIAHGQPALFYQPYPLHIHMQTGLV